MAKIIHVAVAVIHYQQQYLLGYRHASQHQGNCYEFVGGKIENDETPRQGVIREVAEEIGCDISQNLLIKMGVIRHDYPEKTVALHIFKIAINQQQFETLQGEQGSEGQLITWVNKTDLLAKHYPLPDANARILAWLTLPETIFISQSLQQFANAEEWFNFYSKKLPKQAHFYVRPQTDNTHANSLIHTLQKQRDDITLLIQYQTVSHMDGDLEKIILHLNHQQLITLDFNNLPNNRRYFASCHDLHSLNQVNTLAKTHSVMGCFLSPVNATSTHPEQTGMGWQAFGKLARLSDVPVFALGGVPFDALPTAWQFGAMGVAGIRLLDGQKMRVSPLAFTDR